jgi:hypothetical protein
MLKRKMNQSVFTRHYLVADASPREIIIMISLAGLTKLLKLVPGLLDNESEKRGGRKTQYNVRHPFYYYP